jgi:lysine-N-methylase
VTVGLRFSCPSVVANLGQPVSQQRGDILDLAKQVVPANVDQAKPPRVSSSSTVTWPDFHQFVQALDETLAESEKPFIHRLLIALGWVAIVEQASFEKLSGGRITEFLGIVRQAASDSTPENVHQIAAPSSVGRTQFRLLAGHYARKDRYGTHRNPFAGRLRLLTAALKLTSGKGTLPEIQPGLKPVPFGQLEQPFGVPPEANELFERYFRVKVQGLSFCGPAFYHEPFVEGFQSLALMYPAVLWIARWIAAGHGRTSLALEDVADALAIADHHHGYSPALGTWGFRRRVRNLATLNDIAALCAWYTR